LCNVSSGRILPCEVPSLPLTSESREVHDCREARSKPRNYPHTTNALFNQPVLVQVASTIKLHQRARIGSRSLVRYAAGVWVAMLVTASRSTPHARPAPSHNVPYFPSISLFFCGYLPTIIQLAVVWNLLEKVNQEAIGGGGSVYIFVPHRRLKSSIHFWMSFSCIIFFGMVMGDHCLSLFSVG